MDKILVLAINTEEGGGNILEREVGLPRLVKSRTQLKRKHTNYLRFL